MLLLIIGVKDKLYVQLISLRYTISTMYRSYPCLRSVFNTSGYTRLSNVVHDSYSSLIILLLPYVIASNVKAIHTEVPLRNRWILEVKGLLVIFL